MHYRAQVVLVTRDGLHMVNFLRRMCTYMLVVVVQDQALEKHRSILLVDITESLKTM